MPDSNTKTTRTRKTVSKPKTESVSNAETAETVVNNESVAETKELKTTKPTVIKKEIVKHDPDELIECRSIVAGKLLLVGKKSKIQYRWENNDDVQYVEYQDLLAEMLGNSNFIYAPYILIEDDELLNDFRWKRVAELYDSIVDYEEFEQLLQLPNIRFKTVLEHAPKGVKRSIANAISTRLSNGSFDSIQKVQIIDEVCGTDLMCLVSK